MYALWYVCSVIQYCFDLVCIIPGSSVDQALEFHAVSFNYLIHLMLIDVVIRDYKQTTTIIKVIQQTIYKITQRISSDRWPKRNEHV